MSIKWHVKLITKVDFSKSNNIINVGKFPVHKAMYILQMYNSLKNYKTENLTNGIQSKKITICILDYIET